MGLKHTVLSIEVSQPGTTGSAQHLQASDLQENHPCGPAPVESRKNRITVNGC